MSSTMVDWEVAFATASRLVKASPDISASGAAEVVAELRQCAARAEVYVSEVTGLTTPSGTAPVLVVDRPSWIRANLDGFRAILGPLNDKVAAAAESGSFSMTAFGSRMTGVEVGALLSYLAPKVLGQFDPFYPGATDGSVPPEGSGPAKESGPGGRLLLVAPNVVAIERELDVDPADFRLWVCLHEETHRVQFTAVDWLRGYLNSLIGQVVGSADLDPSALAQMVRDGAKRLLDAFGSDTEISLIDLMQTPAQRETVDAITAVMSLLEGHADVVMDGVGPDVISSIESIREKFTVRRRGQGPDKIIRKLLGLDAKMRQYRDGAAFCRKVIEVVGMEGFNRVWTSPDTLPTKAEITDPSRWLARVHPVPAAV